MKALTQPLRGEHRKLLAEVETIRRVADSVGDVPIETLGGGVERVYDFLSRHLIPHAKAEDLALYPVVGRVLGALEATATMSHDHVEVVGLTEQLAALRPELAAAELEPDVERTLRRILYGLYELVRVHFEEEEEIFLPILDARLTEAEAHEMFESMEAAAERIKVGV